MTDRAGGGDAQRAPRVVVVGAGVIGLTCAVRLAEAGYEVGVVARDLPLETTSAVAAALWYPYYAFPRDRVLAWAKTSYAEFERLASTEPESGVRMRSGRDLTRTSATGRPWWAEAVPDLHRLTAGDTCGWQFEAPVVDTSVYLPWLVDRLEALGGTLSRSALPALPTNAPIVVNCTGLAARRMAADESVLPVRGQICVVEQVGLTEWWLADGPAGHPIYVIPRLHDIVLGGTVEPGDWETRPREQTGREILEATRALVPELAGARVIRQRVGLRPARSSVRLEPEYVEEGRLVVHCYGHGGSGITLSWGCADEVVELVRSEAPAGPPVPPQ
ncbi:MAG TPA: FAD-dependent oxidoreductase [Actinopolymorphaceae bacterium]